MSRNLEKADKEVPLETDDADDHPEEDTLQKDLTVDYVVDFATFMNKVTKGASSTLTVTLDNADQVLELSTPRCSMTPLLIDYGFEASDINAVSNVEKLSKKLGVMRTSLVLLNLLGVEKKNMSTTLRKILSELQECVKDTGFIRVVLDSASPLVITKNAKTKLKELKDVMEYVFHPGGNSNHHCSMLTNLPPAYAQYPLAQTSGRAKNRLAVFAVKLRESFKAYLTGKDEWATSCYSELLLDTLIEDADAAEVKELEGWYVSSKISERLFLV